MLDPFATELAVPADRRDALRAYIEGESEWFHSINFEGGLVTPGRDPSSKKLHHLCLPRSLAGLSVIDIGAYDGFFSFHAEARGAARVVAADKYIWEMPDHAAIRNFRTIRDTIGSTVEQVIVDVPTSSASLNEQFDIVLFLGVLYHADNMIEYLNNVARITREVCVVETLVDNLNDTVASAALYDHGELNGDATNWWGPNLLATEVMLRRVGFRHVQLMNMWDVNTIDAIRGQPRLTPVRSGRAVFHAYK